MAANNAQRFSGKPLLQPSYNFRDVPPCARDLAGSTLSEVSDRQHLVDSIAEMVLLCNEATRRRALSGRGGGGGGGTGGQSSAKKPTCTKPLSLEYIFDRIDTDDPLWGFMIRTNTPMTAKGRASSLKASPQWRRGMLQGFVTVTTFTNWQTTYRFDSFNDSAFAYDDEELKTEMMNGIRKYDRDGRLAEELQATVRGGDPWAEGVVYPKIAEISLLGGLGCGKPLMKLIIERLECMKTSGSVNYEYVVLQATGNSIPFYEAMGFIRVGCVQENAPSPRGFCSSPVDTYYTKKNGETPLGISKQTGVDVWDIIFLNVERFNGILPRSWLKQSTPIFIPSRRTKFLATSDALRSKKLGGSWEDVAAAPKWYTAKENDTPRGIAKKFHVKLSEVLKANKKRLPDILSESRFRAGTRVKVSRFDVDDDRYVPYCHWTFPDDKFNSDEPSYMMALKLNRKSGVKAKFRPVADTFAVPIQLYSPEAQGVKDLFIQPVSTRTKKIEPVEKKHHFAEPVKPKRPASSYVMFCNEKRLHLKEEFKGKPMTECTKLMAEKWRTLSEERKEPYRERHKASQANYAEVLKKYGHDLAKFHLENPAVASGCKEPDTSLLEKVVKIKPSGVVSDIASKFQYFYVLTYIPDLQWVHLAPMRKIGTFQTNGRPIWMIVGENEGKEIDTSAASCKLVKSCAIKNTEDADEEEWDIFESGSQPQLAPIFLQNCGKSKSFDVPKFDDSASVPEDLVTIPAFSSSEKTNPKPLCAGRLSPEKKVKQSETYIAANMSSKKRKVASSESAAEKSKMANIVSDGANSDTSRDDSSEQRKKGITYAESPSNSPKKPSNISKHPLKTPREVINTAVYGDSHRAICGEQIITNLVPERNKNCVHVPPAEQPCCQHRWVSTDSCGARHNLSPSHSTGANNDRQHIINYPSGPLRNTLNYHYHSPNDSSQHSRHW